jgi:sporulation protein YlmC with PRC-barrel domain
MRTRYLVSGLFAAALLSSTAFAQTSTAPAAAPAAAPKADVGAPKLASPHWRSSKLIGVNIYNEQNEKLGDINEIILDKEGKVLGYVVGVGGFLGMGEHDILVEPNKIKFVDEPVRSASTTTTTRPATNTATNTNPPAAAPGAAPTNTRPVSNTTANNSNKYAWYPDHGILNATKDQLKAMPQFKYSSYN